MVTLSGAKPQMKNLLVFDKTSLSPSTGDPRNVVPIAAATLCSSATLSAGAPVSVNGGAGVALAQ